MQWFLALVILIGLGCESQGSDTGEKKQAQVFIDPANGTPRLTEPKKDEQPKVDLRIERFVTTARIANSSEKLKEMIDSGVAVNAFNKNGINALMAALLVGRIENAGFLVKNGADLKKKNEKGENAVSYALFSAKNASLKFVRSAGEKLEGLDRKALVRIACLGDAKTIKMALMETKQVNFKDELQETALIHASRCNNEKNVRFLVNAGADINATNDQKRTALIVAAVFNNQNVVRYLLSKGADTGLIDYQNKTALDWAVLLERKQIEIMLKNNAKQKKLPNGHGPLRTQRT